MPGGDQRVEDAAKSYIQGRRAHERALPTCRERCVQYMLQRLQCCLLGIKAQDFSIAWHSA